MTSKVTGGKNIHIHTDISEKTYMKLVKLAVLGKGNWVPGGQELKDTFHAFCIFKIYK